VRRDERTGDVILSKKAAWSTWNEYFEQRDSAAGAVRTARLAEKVEKFLTGIHTLPWDELAADESPGFGLISSEVELTSGAWIP
jgi:hypothetical protein